MMLIFASAAYGQGLTLYRDQATDIAPIGTVYLRPSSAPAAPTTGSYLFADEENSSALTILRDNGNLDVIVSGFKGQIDDDETSTNSTSYVTVLEQPLVVSTPGTYLALISAETAGQDNATRGQIRITVPEIPVTIGEVYLDYDGTEASDQWNQYASLCFQALTTPGTYTITLEYRTTNAAKTVYLRRARVACFRVE